MSHDAGRRPPPAVPGPIIGPYQFGKTVGKGSFGKVKEATFLPTGDKVAIKIINRQLLTNNNGMDAKIAREIKILKLFRHNNICRLYDVRTTPSDILVVMEYIQGQELYDVIVERGKLSEPDARYIFQQLICAVEYWHHYRVVHRDLKPENILLERDLTVKVIDFGLANLMKDGVFLRTSCGSPNYAAPEVINGRLYVGPEIDVWSSGVILFALLCGCLPFDEETIPALFKKIKAGEYRIPSHVSPDARDLLKRMMTVDPLDRITIPQIRDHVWFAAALPRFLHYRPNLFENASNIDLSLAQPVAAVMKMNPSEVLAIVQRRESSSLSKQQSAVLVAWDILADARKRREIEEMRKLDQSESGSTVTASQHTGSTAAQRELNQGLMLTTSPAMAALLDTGTARGVKNLYNSQSFVPASMQDSRVLSTGSLRVAATPGTFCFAGNPSSFQDKVGSLHSTYMAASAPRREINHSSQGQAYPPTTASGAPLSPQAAPSAPLSNASGQMQMVGSVAKPNAVYDAGESAVAVENNVGWRVGIMTELSSAHVVSELLQVLRESLMEWKVESPFVINTRFTSQPSMSLQMQLMRLHESKHDQGFVVDFHVIRGNSLLALETAVVIGEKLVRRIG